MTPVLIFDFADSLLSPAARSGSADRSIAPASSRLIFAEPVEVLQAHDVSEVRAVLRAAEAATRRGWYAAGFVAYEAAPAFDPAHVVRTADPSSAGALPLAWFGIYRAPVRGDEVAATPAVTAHPQKRAAAEPVIPRLEPAIDRDTYDAAVAHIRDSIADGDVYQVNYTFPLRGTIAADDVAPATTRALYERLARERHGGYGAYLDIGTHRLLSFSPELFFERVGDRTICRPMKGTVARGRWTEEDAARAAWLAASEKNRAENVMIVDLVRNDLGRVARVGGVRVSSLCAIERYPTVWQMTSTIEADLRGGAEQVGAGHIDAGCVDAERYASIHDGAGRGGAEHSEQATSLEAIFETLFPCGSITGAPKISAMRQIAALESSPRGAYCGAIGFAGPDRTVFNVAIRTLTVDVAARTATYPVGGGVTWDSRSREEYAEALAKAALLQPRPPFQLLETMRVDDGAIVRESRHLARMIASARYFAFVSTDADAAALERRAREALHARADAHPHGSWRLRLLVSASGAIETTIVPCDRPDPVGAKPDAASHSPRPIALARTAVDPEDPFLCHKTTHRVTYDAHRADHPDAFDVLLFNTRGELTEFTIGNLVLALDSARVTPPRTSGLLAGTFRDALIAEGTIREQLLTLDDLRRADAIWLINGVREWVPVTLVDTASTAATPSSSTSPRSEAASSAAATHMHDRA